MSEKEILQENPILGKTDTPVAVPIYDVEPSSNDARSSMDTSRSTTYDPFPPMTDYHIRGEKSTVIGAISMVLCCLAGTTAQSVIVGYPECCGCFWNIEACCHRCQCGCITFDDPRKSIRCCVCEAIEKPKCSIRGHIQHLFHDGRGEITCCCCSDVVGTDPDLLFGSLVIWGWNVYPVNGCCKTVYEIKSELADPRAYRLAMCYPDRVKQRSKPSHNSVEVGSNTIY